MTTFSGSAGSRPMLDSVGEMINDLQWEDEDIDVHTITLILNGQHGEFDLLVEATDENMEDLKWNGVAHRTGGVSDFGQVED